MPRRVISIIIPVIIFFISHEIARSISDNRIIRIAILANIFFLFSIVVIVISRRKPGLFGFDDRIPLPRVDLGIATLSTGAATASAAAAVVMFDHVVAEAAILGVIVLAALVGWLFRDKRTPNGGLNSSKDSSS